MQLTQWEIYLQQPLKVYLYSPYNATSTNYTLVPDVTASTSNNIVKESLIRCVLNSLAISRYIDRCFINSKAESTVGNHLETDKTGYFSETSGRFAAVFPGIFYRFIYLF